MRDPGSPNTVQPSAWTCTVYSSPVVSDVMGYKSVTQAWSEGVAQGWDVWVGIWVAWLYLLGRWDGLMDDRKCRGVF